MPPYYESAPHRGGLLDLTPHSTAPTELVGRLLDEHERVGLSDGQLRELLRVQAVYRRVQRGLEVKMVLLAEQLRVSPERLTPAGRADRLRLHRTRGSLFAQHGVNADIALAAVFAVLSGEQFRRLGAVYMADVDAMVETLAPVLVAAVTPRYALALDTADGLEEVDPGPPGQCELEDADRLDVVLTSPRAEADRGLQVLQGQA